MGQDASKEGEPRFERKSLDPVKWARALTKPSNKDDTNGPDHNCRRKLRKQLEHKRFTDIPNTVVHRTKAELVQKSKLCQIQMCPEDVYKFMSMDKPIRPVLKPRWKALQDSMFSAGVIGSAGVLTAYLEIDNDGTREEVNKTLLHTVDLVLQSKSLLLLLYAWNRSCGSRLPELLYLLFLPYS